MYKAVVAEGTRTRVIAMDSITLVGTEDAGAIVVSGSHGGSSSGEIALEIPLAAVFFNDAGIGKDDAGVAALAMLQARGIAAGTVAHTSARIGDAQDIWAHGVISRVNAAAAALGCLPGTPLREALAALVSG
jgi:hypothetical protein